MKFSHDVLYSFTEIVYYLIERGENMEQIKIGRFIAELRKSKGMTQEEMAERLGVSGKTVSRWENGRNLPDASLFEPVCELLDITLTELFCGEKIEQTQIVEKAEESMAATVDYAEKTVKRQNKRFVAVIAAFAVTLVGMLVLFEAVYFTPCASHPGDVSQWQGLFPAHSAYLLALNDENKPVFADPVKALAQAKVDYSEAISAVKSEHHLLPLSRYYYNAYGVFGWQIVTDDDMLCKQGAQLSQFIDIYENSFR